MQAHFVRQVYFFNPGHLSVTNGSGITRAWKPQGHYLEQFFVSHKVNQWVATIVAQAFAQSDIHSHLLYNFVLIAKDAVEGIKYSVLLSVLIIKHPTVELINRCFFSHQDCHDCGIVQFSISSWAPGRASTASDQWIGCWISVYSSAYP